MGLAITGVTPEAMRLLHGVRLAGQRARAGEHHRAGHGADRDRPDRRRQPARPGAASGRADARRRRRPPSEGDDLSIKRASRRAEEELIRRALAKTGNRTRAAELLEISHRALLYKIKEYGIASPSGRRRTRRRPAPLPSTREARRFDVRSTCKPLTLSSEQLGVDQAGASPRRYPRLRRRWSAAASANLGAHVASGRSAEMLRGVMPRYCIGLDIGSNSVKAVQLKETGKGFQLLSFGHRAAARRRPSSTGRS